MISAEALVAVSENECHKPGGIDQDKAHSKQFLPPLIGFLLYNTRIVNLTATNGLAFLQCPEPVIFEEIFGSKNCSYVQRSTSI